MLKAFVSHIQRKDLFTKDGYLPTGEACFLVAVSGGVDSMVLCDLMAKSKHQFSVVHCNFKLRGSDSDADEEFVKEYCKKNNLNFYMRSFDTLAYAEEKKISIQMAARELRYAFFSELMKEHSFSYLLTAHHLSDNVETFLINMIRGTGIAGLKGISEKRDKIVRPLLAFTKEELMNYAKENSLSYRTDHSNTDDHYVRNNIRLNIIPRLKSINPDLEHTLGKEIGLLEQYHKVIAEHFKNEKINAVIKINSHIKISIEKIKQNSTPELFLFEILKEYGFHPEVIHDVHESLTGIPGKIFYSDAYQLVKDREYLVIQERKDHNIPPTIIEKETQELLAPVHLKLQQVKTFTKENNMGVAYIDVSKITYPLTLRGWQTGDKFKPLGMNGFKKLSDLFVDLKLNAFEKNKIAVLENGNKEIIWVVNHRLDDRYKISESTSNILRIECIE